MAQGLHPWCRYRNRTRHDRRGPLWGDQTGPQGRGARPDHEGSVPYELSQQICSPSYVSLESALAFHGWIPEAVYAIQAVTPKRARGQENPVGRFTFSRTPLRGFYLGVERRQKLDFMIATPWKAIADLVYVRRKGWDSCDSRSQDLPIERQTLAQNDVELLGALSEEYPSPRVRKVL